MSTCVTNSLGLCASFAAADQGNRTKVMSLRRTLSADVSSKTWSSVVETGEDVVDSPADCRSLDKDELNRPSQIDIWTSILSHKNDSHSAVPPPAYVHPLVKRSATLSKKSLEICTESLGSETGSDVFSSSHISSNHVKIETQKSLPLTVDEQVRVVKYKKSSGVKSFPPPLPSLSRRDDGASLHIHSHRENGRLVLAAVSIPTQNNFHAQRQNGRLLLTFVNENKSDLLEVTEKNDAIDKTEDGETEEGLEEVNTKRNMKVETPKVVQYVHRPTYVVNKVVRLTSRHTSIWTTNNLNKVVKVELQAEDQEDPDQLDPKSRASPPSMTSALTSNASTFNTYEYWWRRKPTSATTQVFTSSPSDDRPPSSPGKDSNLQNEHKMATNFLVLRGKRGEGEFIVPYLKGCKDPKRSLLYREPYCIATS